MTRSLRSLPAAWACSLVLAVAALAVPYPDATPAAAQPPAKDELPGGLRFVPPDAAFFLHGDHRKVWDSAVLKAVRKADAKTFDFLLAMAKSDFGLTPEDVKSMTIFVPSFEGGPNVGIVVTLNKAFEKEKLLKGAEKLFGKNQQVKVVAADDRTAVVLLALGEEYAKPQPADKTGPLTATLKEAAGGKFAAVLGMNMTAVPEFLRGDDAPPELRPYQPLFKAQTITATVDLEKNPTLDIRVKTATAGQAIDCEKSLGLFLGMTQDKLAEGVKSLEKEAEKDAGLKDLVTLMKAGGAAMKDAKFATLGTEARVTLSLNADLPFGGAFVAARKKIEEQKANAQASNNLHQIGIAVANHASATNGNLLPAAVCDKRAKPLLSWRVLILPYVGEDKLYKEFKLDEPWDSEHNKKLLDKMPRVFTIPGVTKPGETNTHFRVFVGNGAGWEWVGGLRYPASFEDGTSNTILCVTAAEAVPWTKPDELPFDPEKDMRKLLGGFADGRAMAALFDGSTRSINPEKLSEKAMKAAITRAAGDVLDETW